MSYEDPIDATGYDYEQWIRFAFDHPVSEKPNRPWYYTEEMHFVCDPNVVIAYYARLFRDPRPSLSAYDDSRLDQGVWFVVGSQLASWLWDDDIPVELRLDCIAAMPTMFREFLVDRPLKAACWMWWDMLRSFDDDPDPRIVGGMVRALADVLQLPAQHCQMSALHGLGHLKHEAKETIIRTFIADGRDLNRELLEYAERAINGTVL
jgi:hypothetical protein